MVDVGKREDLLLEKIHDLSKRRDAALRLLEAWRISDPPNADFIEFIELELR